MMDLIFSWLWLIVAALFLFHYMNDIRHLKIIEGWIQTEGEISHCQLNNDNRRYQLSVQYQYKVADQAYTSNVIQSPHDPRPFFSEAIRLFYYSLVRAFEGRQSIDVFYNPDDPNDAVLYRAHSMRLYVYCALFFGFIFFHVVTMLN